MELSDFVDYHLPALEADEGTTARLYSYAKLGFRPACDSWRIIRDARQNT